MQKIVQSSKIILGLILMLVFMPGISTTLRAETVTVNRDGLTVKASVGYILSGKFTDLPTDPENAKDGSIKIMVKLDLSGEGKDLKGKTFTIHFKDENMFRELPFSLANRTTLKNSTSNEKVADLSYTQDETDDYVSMTIKFVDDPSWENFHANVEFESLRNQTEVDRKLMNNNQDQIMSYFNLSLEYQSKNVSLGSYPLKYKKRPPLTEATYNKVGAKRVGSQDTIIYNFNYSSLLRDSNEFILYDTPDVNMQFVSNSLSVLVYNEAKTNWNRINLDQDHGVLYDIYYKTETSSPTLPGHAVYEEVENLTLLTDDPRDRTKKLTSHASVIIPKNIILTKPAGQSLTQDDIALINENGGLNQKVSKGFMLRLVNIPRYEGASAIHMSIEYDAKIINTPSTKLNSDNDPLYSNSASLYGQEIPACTNELECSPINFEKNKTGGDQGFESNTNINKEVALTPPTIDVTTNSIPREVRFKKLDQNQNPVPGAKFSIHKNNETGEIVVLDGVTYSNLITNEDGSLTKDGIPLELKLLPGTYCFVEDEIPEGYTTEVTSSYLVIARSVEVSDLIVINQKNIEEVNIPHTPSITTPKPATVHYPIEKKAVPKTGV